MNLSVRDGKFDVIIVAGPRIDNWPSTGVKTLSSLCAEMGLMVGQFGGDSIFPRGVLPLPGTGGVVLLEDIQKRIHRLRARAIVRIVPESLMPDPFPGWYSQGLIPLSTAERILKEGQINWEPTTVLLGTGNRALRFGSRLLESSATSEVYCVEPYSQWKAKRFAGWEVERRRFEILGGKMIEAKPIQLLPKGPQLWQLRLQDLQGIRVLEVGRMVSCGPYRDITGVREYPAGSFLFELDQTADSTQAKDVEGWVVEEERAKWLATKIVKALSTDLGSRREELDQIYRRSRSRLKRYFKHREEPFTPSYQGKWTAVSDFKRLRSFGGVPKELHKTKPIASIECVEEIPCNLCQTVCPTNAIQIGKGARARNEILTESACISCGACLEICPAGAISSIYEKETESTVQLTLPWRGTKAWKTGEQALLVNRRGDSLGSVRIAGVVTSEKQTDLQLVQVNAPIHLQWEARGLKRPKVQASVDTFFLAQNESKKLEEKVEISLNGERRLVRDRIPLTLALFEIGQSRPEDNLYCPDGSCGLCHLLVDSVQKLACQTKIRRGMAIRTTPAAPASLTPVAENQLICPCLNISQKTVSERLKHGSLHSAEAVLSMTHVGTGRCHGQLCMGAFKRVLLDLGLDVSQWIDWRFPWTEWTLTHS